MCRERLQDVGFDVPEWGDVARGQRLGRSPQNRDPTELQVTMCLVSEEKTYHGFQALLTSHCCPFAGIPFTCSQMMVESRLEPQIFGSVAFIADSLWIFCFLLQPFSFQSHSSLVLLTHIFNQGISVSVTKKKTLKSKKRTIASFSKETRNVHPNQLESHR